MKIIEMSDDRVRRRRGCQCARRTVPVAKPNAANNDLSANVQTEHVLSGVKEPQLSVTASEEPLAVLPTAVATAAAIAGQLASRLRFATPIQTHYARSAREAAYTRQGVSRYVYKRAAAGWRRRNGNGHGHAEVLLQAENIEAEFQRLKTGIHRELLDSLDLSRITGLSDDELREDIRHLAEGMLRTRSQSCPRSTKSG